MRTPCRVMINQYECSIQERAMGVKIKNRTLVFH
jgi:hypothetical protein